MHVKNAPAVLRSAARAGRKNATPGKGSDGMKTSRVGCLIAAMVMGLAVVSPGNAQSPAPARLQVAAKASCVPSGFAKLTRNCDQNVGRCQRMPQSCNKGWCCP
jgi:hypothetical protein